MRSSRRQDSFDTERLHRDRWLLSYADLVTLLLALFIVMYAAGDHERARKIANSFSHQINIGGDGILPENNALNDDNDRYDKKLLENPVLIAQTKMRQTERGFVVSLAETGFFAPGEALISSEAGEVINAVAATLNGTGVPVRIEGHTDSTPISNSRYPSNWDLSTARASRVLLKLTEEGIAPERLSAAGYGGFQPVADNNSEEGRAQNRRVDIVLLNR